MSDWPIFVFGLLVSAIVMSVVVLIGRMEAEDVASRKLARERQTGERKTP